MGQRKHVQGKYKVPRNIIYFFLGAGVAACWNLQRSVHMPLKNLAIDSILFGVVAVIAIRSGDYILKYVKQMKRRRSRRSKSANYDERAKHVREKGKVSW